MIKWILGIVSTVLITSITALLSYMAAGIVDAKSLESRVHKLENWATVRDNSDLEFRSQIKSDMGYIKGQNDHIIKLLKEEK